MTVTLVTLLFWLLVGHALGDFPLQGEFLSMAKRPDTRHGQNGFWFFALTAHALIHAGLTAIALRLALPLQSDRLILIPILEFVAHWATDFSKSRGRIGMKADQAVHFACKLAWVIIAWG